MGVAASSSAERCAEVQGQKVECQGSFLSCFSTETSGFDPEKPETFEMTQAAMEWARGP